MNLHHLTISLVLALLAVSHTPLHAQSLPSQKAFPARNDIYHKGWIDFNKNGKKDIYEDPSQSIDARIANLLMNIGPQPNGELPATALLRLKEMGEWLNTYGETVYGTRAGLVAPHNWGVTTTKGNKLYVHILDLKDPEVYLPLKERIAGARLYKGGTPVKYTVTKSGVVLNIGDIPAEEIDHIVELTLKK